MTIFSKISDLPHNFEAEQALLGAILLDNHVHQRVTEIVRREHFADPMHGELYGAIEAVINRGQQATPFTLKAYIDSIPKLRESGGLKYLATLAGASFSVIDAPTFARTIRDAAARRELISIGTEVVATANAPDVDDTPAAAIERAERRLYDLAEDNAEGGFTGFTQSLVKTTEQAEAAHKRGGKLSGVTTGFRSLDGLLGGLHRSDLIILAARPSMGKTALATNIAVAAAAAHRSEEDEHGQVVTVEGARVGLFSLEMSCEQITTRIVSDKAGISGDRVRKGDLTSGEFQRFLEASVAYESLPVWIDDTAALSISQIRTRARRLKRQHGLELLIVDHMQLIQPDERRRNGNRVEEMSAISAGLKAIAKELDIPVIALSQLSRAVENRVDKRPQLADLRESGSIEQDADVVMFIYREAYYLERQGLDVPHDLVDRAEILVEKQRHGPIGALKMKFEAWLTRFSDLEGP